MLLIVGEAIVAYQRDLGPGGADTGQPYTGPWASGSPAITAYVAARLGVPTEFVGGVGADDGGEVMRAAFALGGVGTAGLHVSPRPTATARITYRGVDDRAFEFAVAGSAAVDVPEAALGDLPERAAWVHLSGSALAFGEPLARTALTAFRRARRAGARTSVDPNVRAEVLADGVRDELLDAIGQADVLLPSEGELAALGLDAADLVAGGATVCTTLGPAGAVVHDATGETRVPAVPGPVVDADGAGDSFAAGFIAARLGGADPVRAAETGARVAAAAIAVAGPMTVRLTPADR